MRYGTRVLAAGLAGAAVVWIILGYYSSSRALERSSEREEAMYSALRDLAGGELRTLACDNWGQGDPKSEEDWWIELSGLSPSQVDQPLLDLPTGLSTVILVSEEECFKTGRSGRYYLHVSGYGEAGVRELRKRARLRIGADEIPVSDLWSFMSIPLLRESVLVSNTREDQGPTLPRRLDRREYATVRVEAPPGGLPATWARFEPRPPIQVHFFSEGRWYCSVAFFVDQSDVDAEVILYGIRGTQVRRQGAEVE
ncbi:MAG: hypothetical protein KatS3mg015_2182 [Fimbriimonadales bacterium]|nr:MAG: hypothetical protein KatS3mg015_2182 [Fimbriimonadales bacterium]